MIRRELMADCARCAALCCVAPSFEASAEFAFDKPAGAPCPYLTPECRCAVHAERLVRGLVGCTVYECHGAGQRVSRAFAGAPSSHPQRDRAFLRVRPLHELMWLLSAAHPLCPASEPALRAELEGALAELDALVERLLHTELDTRAHEAHARGLLLRVGHALGGRRGLRVMRDAG
jgi:hypothetical protein